MKTNNNYDAQSIEVLSGLDPVKKRPGMYTDTSRPNHIAMEVIDNSVDEAMAGHANEIFVTIFEDNSIEVWDDGRGMPTDEHPKEKISGVEVIMTKLHAGGKFSNKAYKFSGGLHGVGISVVNALSKVVEVEIKRNKKIYGISFNESYQTSKLKHIGNLKNNETGTKIRFWPDTKYFDNIKIDVKKLKNALKAKAILCQGLKISLSTPGEQTITWQYEDGLYSYAQEALKGLECIPEEFFTNKFTNDDEEVEWICTWTPNNLPILNNSYVNLIPTALGGTHVTSFKGGLIDGLKDFCKFHNLIPKGLNITTDDLWNNCNYILSIKLKEPQFLGQTKDKLTSRQCVSFITKVVSDAFAIWLNHNIIDGKKLVEVVIENANNRIKKLQKSQRKKFISGPALPGKLSDCIMSDVESCELFIVEGDSAGGSAKQARNKDNQAVMPIRGKILNTWEISSQKILASQIVNDISIAIGVEPGANNTDTLRYGKICILADADSDGKHIAALLCALFVKHYPNIVENGNIYVAMPPLYRIDIGKKVFYALDDEEKKEITTVHDSSNSKMSIQRFKGLGEMNALQLKETTMDPSSRKLVQLTMSNDNQKENPMEVFDMLLSKRKSSNRKEWLEKKGNLAQI